MDSRTLPETEREASARLLSLAAHELRTPVSVVGGYLRMLQRDETLNERQRKMIDEADKACARLVAIIKEVSEVGKLDDGRTRLQSEGLDLFGLLRDIAGSVDEASDRGVRLALHGCDVAATIRGDRLHLRDTFTALMRAVLREQHDEAVVRVDCQLHADRVLIVIGRSDRLDSVLKQPRAPFDDQRGGLGLMLPIARRVIEGHGGTIWSPADAEGKTTARSAVLVELPTNT